MRLLKVCLAFIMGLSIDCHPVELVDRIQDSDEKVRAAICKVIGSLDYEAALHHVSIGTLRAVGGRLSDKKVSSAASKDD